MSLTAVLGGVLGIVGASGAITAVAKITVPPPEISSDPQKLAIYEGDKRANFWNSILLTTVGGGLLYLGLRKS